MTGSARPRYALLATISLLVVFLIFAYQNVMVTTPIWTLRGEFIERTNHSENERHPNDIRHTGKTRLQHFVKKWNPRDFAPYPPKFGNLSDKTAPDPLLVDTQACRILNKNPRDPSLDGIIVDDQETFHCVGGNLTGGLVFIKNRVLRVNNDVRERVLSFYNADFESFRCKVEYIKRYPVEEDDWITRSLGPARTFINETKVRDEFMKIECFVNETVLVYETYDFAVLRKSDVEARCATVQRLQRAKGTFCEDQLSVLLLGVDSLSRLTSMRHLSKTREVLDSMGAIEFLGYNKIGGNTFPNMFGLLTGRRASDLEFRCWNEKEVFDNCTFLWDTFAAAGYRTAFVENMEYFGLFTYAKKGFRRQPADYYGRVFFTGAGNILKPFVNGCLRNVSEDEAVFQWALEYQREFARDRHFGYFWISLFSHDNFNDIQQVDPFLSRTLESLSKEDLLNNTMLIVLGDHGPRYGSLMQTAIGKYESNLPPMYLVFPEWFQKKHPKEMQNLRVNARNRLVTHLDLHSTIKDIINCSVSRASDSKPAAAPQQQQSVSLFRRISENRTCFDAGIPEMYCGCHKDAVALDTNSTLADQLSAIAIRRLNNITASQRALCAELTLNNTDEVKVRLNNNAKKSMNLSEDVTFEVIFSTTPGTGKYWAYVHYTKSDGKFTVDDDISRLSAYGNSSACIKEPPQMLPVCYCIEQWG